MFTRLQTLWECFTVWHVEPTSLKNAQVICAHAAGDTPDGPSITTHHLADIIRVVHREYALGIIAQGETAQCLNGLPVLTATPRQAEADHYIDTREVVLFHKRACEQLNFSRIVLVAFGHHLWRAKKTAERLGLVVYIPEGIESPYDPHSTQWQCRSAWFFIPREILTRTYYWLRGWI